MGNNHLLQSVGSINEEYLTTCENNDHLSKVKDVSTDNSCSLSQHVDISPAESFRETRIQYLKDINAVVLKKSRHCVDNDFNRTADAFIAIEHSNFNADGVSFSCIIDALEAQSRINRLRKESLYQEAADIRHEYDMLRLCAKESLCEKDKGSKFEAILNSPYPFCIPSHVINESYSILSSKLNGGAFCCLFYFLWSWKKHRLRNFLVPTLNLVYYSIDLGLNEILIQLILNLKIICFQSRSIVHQFSSRCLYWSVSALSYLMIILNLLLVLVFFCFEVNFG